MTTHKHIDRICCIAMILAMLVTVLFLNADSLGIQAADKMMGYEERLFDAENVHTIDIIIDDWDAFLATCQSEEYSVCNVLIDGEAYTNVGIRGKGNTSLSTVSSMDSERYSFKIEFDQYDNTKSYYGLDKLCLNNIIQDNTYMKDFLVYQMMEEFGVDAPLCSYVYITVNGEDWGLYLAVEGIEDGFLQRNYGSDYGELYKPDSMSFGGGRGNGKDFDMGDFDFSQFGGGEMPDMGDMFGGEMPDMSGGFPGGNMQMPGGMEFPGGMTIPEGTEKNEDPTKDEEEGSRGKSGNHRDFNNMMGGMGGFGMGSSDVKLQYIDDNASSYSNIFNNAKNDITENDEQRLIASLKTLSEGEAIASVVDVEEVIRYFVVHNFVVNGDSYTGSMIHNYYLYEEDGQLSMIPWDYNLAYGTFQGNDAESAVNDPIDSPVNGGTSDRPMIHWIFENEEYTEMYHQYFVEFIEKYYTNGELTALIDDTAELIAPYVEKDPTKFCTYEEFETGVATIREFCLLRAESVSGQLDGTIPSTSEGQSTDSSNLIDASRLNISAMGTMGGSGGMGGFSGMGGGRGDRTEGSSRGESFGGDESSDDANENSAGNSFGNFGDFREMFGGEMPDMGNMQFSGASGSGSTGSSAGATVVLLVASVVVMLIGLLVAYRYKR